MASAPVDIESQRGDDAEVDFGNLFNSLPEKTETIDRLESYFGDQKFCYGTHIGTFADMMALCPAVDGMVEQGFEAAISLLEPYKISEEEYQRALNPDEPKDENVNGKNDSEEGKSSASESPQDNQANDVSEEVDIHHVQTNRVIPGEQQHAGMMKENNKDEVVFTPLAEHEINNIVEADDRGSQKLIDTVTRQEPEIAPEITIPKPSLPLPIELFRSEHVTMPAIEYEAETHESIAMASDESAVVEHPKLVELDAVEPTIEVVARAVVEPPEYISREQARELPQPLKVADTFLIPNEYLLDEPVEVADHGDTLEDATLESVLAESNDVQPPTEDENAMVEVDNVVRPSILQQAYENIEGGEETVAEVAVDPMVETVADTVAKLVAVEPEFEADVDLQECTWLLQDAQSAVARLKHATSKEECEERLAELEASLQRLLEALGFDNTEQLAAQLARRYDTKTLRQYIAALMRTVAAPEITNRGGRARRTLPRHRWLGQHVVGRVLGAKPFSSPLA